MGYRIINGKAYPISDISNLHNTNQKNVTNNSSNNFKDVLNNAIEQKNSFTISKHASERLNEINFTQTDMNNIEKGFKLAEEKGSKNSVMLYKDVAIIASIENKTVITAVDKDRAKDNVYTNIDSVVIL